MGMPKYTTRAKTYLNLQEIIPANTLVVHLMVGIVGITAAFVLNKSEPGERVRDL
jgi:hypothetical protein